MALSVVLMLLAGLTPAEIVQRNQHAVVTVYGETASHNSIQSSGCIVSAAGLILTTAHQVVGVTHLCARMYDGREIPLELAVLDEKHELALLKSPAKNLAAAAIGTVDTLTAGSPLTAIAAPRDLAATTATGIVSNPARTYKGYRVLQTNLAADPGSSGGPVFDEQGLLIGLIIGKLQDQDSVTLVNPINNAYALLETAGIAFRPGVLGAEPATEVEIAPAAGISDKEREAILAYNRGVAADTPRAKIAAYQSATRMLPRFYEAWFNLAIAYTASGDDERALKAYETAAAIRPGAPESARNAALILQRLNRLRDAADWLEKAAEKAPENSAVRNDLGEIWRRLGDREKAERYLREALRIRPDMAAAAYNLALTMADSGRNEEAAAMLDKYIELTPAASDIEQAKAWIQQLRGRPEGE